MKPAPFRYAAPRQLEEALALLGQHGGDAKVLAGGQSLVPMMSLRLARPAVLLDIGRLPGLDGWRAEGDAIEIGALLRQRRLELDGGLKQRLPLLAEAALQIGHPATRSRGTVVGSLCHADPAAELPACAVALKGEIAVRSARGERRIAAHDFFRDAMTTAVTEDELAVAVRLPAARPRSGFALLEVARRHGDFALVAVACALRLDDKGAVAEAGLALGGVGRAPVALPEIEEALSGRKPEGALLKELAASASEALDPPSDLHANARYRKRAARALIERALGIAAERAGRTA